MHIIHSHERDLVFATLGVKIYTDVVGGFIASGGSAKVLTTIVSSLRGICPRHKIIICTFYYPLLCIPKYHIILAPTTVGAIQWGCHLGVGVRKRVGRGACIAPQSVVGLRGWWWRLHQPIASRLTSGQRLAPTTKFPVVRRRVTERENSTRTNTDATQISINRTFGRTPNHIFDPENRSLTLFPLLLL